MTFALLEAFEMFGGGMPWAAWKEGTMNSFEYDCECEGPASITFLSVIRENAASEAF